MDLTQMEKIEEKTTQVPNPGPLKLSPKLRIVLGMCVLIGIATFIIALNKAPQKAWSNFLVNQFYFLCLSLAGVFFVALHHATRATWAVAIRRVAEGVSVYLPVAALLYLGIILGAKYIYPWAKPGFIEAHPLHYEGSPPLGGRANYLTVPFFSARIVGSILIWILFTYLLVRNSLKQEQTQAFELSSKNTKLSVAFLPIFALTFTLTAFDLLMSLEPRWYSTIFAVYCFAGLFQAGLSLIIILTIWLRRQGPLAEIVKPDHLKDLGVLLFAFTVFMAYIGFSQFMLIWYANLPEETFFFMRRIKSGWLSYAVAIPILKFVIPFLALLSQSAKRNEKIMLTVATMVLLGEWLDIYWIVVPVFQETPPVWGWVEIGMLIGFWGVFWYAVTSFFRKNSVLATGDPKILDSINWKH
ncbi:MAG: hypothetical protein A2145_05320 [candidate division Zixibacteria bacterium RBG_16_40_9]|nr:MAG: hypothetical protein A2145_05320 [candidate division Zixibacteria bacterium RBG_16_40_9]